MKREGFYKKLVLLAAPIAFQQLMLAIVGATETLMLGKLEQESMSAVALAGQVLYVLNLFVGGIGVGMSLLSAQYFGKNDMESIERILAIVLRVSICVSFVFFVAAFFMPGWLMRIFTSENILIELGSGYLRVVCFTYIFYGVSQIYLVVMKNTGKAMQASMITSFSVVMNIVLNGILIFGLCGMPSLGIMGAAIASLVSRATECILALLVSGMPGGVRIRWIYLFHVKTDRGIVLRNNFWKYATPPLCESLVWGMGITTYSVILGHMGEAAVAANSLVVIVNNMVVSLMVGVKVSSGILIGYELGAGKLEQAKKLGDKCVKGAYVIGVVCASLTLLSIRILQFLVPLSPDAGKYLIGMLVICAITMLGQATCCVVVGGILSAGGDARYSLKMCIITMWGIVIPLGFAAAFLLEFPVYVVYAILYSEAILRALPVMKRYKKYHWVKNLTK